MFSPDGTLISASAAPHCGVSLREGILLHTAAADKTRRQSSFVSNCVSRTHDEHCKCVGGVTSYIAGSSAPISPIRNLFSQNQHEIASTGKQIFLVGRPEVLSQSLPSFRYRLSVVYQKSLNVSEQNCNIYWSKV